MTQCEYEYPVNYFNVKKASTDFSGGHLTSKNTFSEKLWTLLKPSQHFPEYIFLIIEFYFGASHKF